MTLSAGLANLVMPSAGLLAQGGGFWMPRASSTFAGEVDAVFDFILYVSIFFFVVIVGVALYFVVRYRRREGVIGSGATHNTPLELFWSIIPLILVVVMFWWGFRVFIDMRTPPENAYEVGVHAQQWNWEFSYPRGITHDELHVPGDRPIKLVMESADVLHAFFVPAFRVKQDLVPGRYTTVWFQAQYDDSPDAKNEYVLACAEYCGTNHSDMITKVVVHTPEGFEDWLAHADPLNGLTPEQVDEYRANPEKFIGEHPEIKGLMLPAMMGEKLYRKKGCTQCHSIDGSIVIGPSFKGVWGKQEPLTDGSTVLVDENYVRESILNPNAKVRAGFDPVMSTYQGRIKDREITMIIAFLKSLADQGGAEQ